VTVKSAEETNKPTSEPEKPAPTTKLPAPAAAVPSPKTAPSIGAPTKAPEQPAEPERDVDAEFLNMLDEPLQKPAPKKSLSLGGKKPSAKKVSSLSPAVEKTPNAQEKTGEQEVIQAHQVETPEIPKEKREKPTSATETSAEVIAPSLTAVESPQPAENVVSPGPSKAKSPASPTATMTLGVQAADVSETGGWNTDDDGIDDSLHHEPKGDISGASAATKADFFDLKLTGDPTNLAAMIQQELKDDDLSLKRAKGVQSDHFDDGEEEEKKTDNPVRHKC